MAVGDRYRVTATFTMPESTIAQWVWHYIQEQAGDPDEQILLDAIETVLTAAFAEIDQAVSPKVQGDTLELALFDQLTGKFNTTLTNDISALVGTSVDEMLPHQEAAVVKFFTPIAKSLGKKFIFGLTENQQEDSILIASAITALILFADEFRIRVTPQGISFAAGNFDPVLDTFRKWTNTVSINAILGTQDRRRPGIGI